MLNRNQRWWLLALLGFGLGVAGLAYLVPLPYQAQAAVMWSFVGIGVVGTGLLVVRGVRSKSPSERRDNGLNAAYVAINSMAIALLAVGKIGWVLVASAANVVLWAAEYRARIADASRRS